MMKRMFVVLAMVPMFAQAADLSVGTIQITGGSNLGFDAGSREWKGATEKTKTTDLDFDLTGLYYVTSNIGVGLGASYGMESAKTGDVKNSSTLLLIGPAAGVNYSINEKAAAFAVLNVGYVASNESTEITGLPKEEDKMSGFGVDVGVGAKYFLAKSFSLDGSVGYQWAKTTGEAPAGGGEKPELTSSGFGFNVGLSVYFDAAGGQ